MKVFSLFIGICFFSFTSALAQSPAEKWADSVLKTLSKEQRIAQLMIVRFSIIDPKTKQVVFFDKEITKLIKKYNVGGVCLFQGDAVEQAKRLNTLQAMAPTPLMVCIDAEWGVGMRLKAVKSLPKQMMLGAMTNRQLVYDYGKLVAEQCKRLGIQVNYAPVVDVNNNANNPVINDRSFGEDKYKVAEYGIAYMKGMQDNNVMATAKHFPGHGDVSVDSHYDLPVINKSLASLDSLELYPFKRIFEAGVGAVMVAHLYIPAIDTTANRATSLSPANINGLMRGTLNYQGLTFTDGLEMQGVQKFYPGGESSVESIVAGNDMLCLPTDVPSSIAKIKAAIKQKRISWADIDMHCRKVLVAKYDYGVYNVAPIPLNNIDADLNKGIDEMRQKIAEEAITLASHDNFFPLKKFKTDKIAYVAVGVTTGNAITAAMIKDYKADIFFASGNNDSLVEKLSKYNAVIVGVHDMTRSTNSNYGISASEASLVNAIEKKCNAATIVFGNPYSLKSFCDIKNLVVTYEDDEIIQATVVKMINGDLPFKGVLPVTVCPNLKFGTGINFSSSEVQLKKKYFDTGNDNAFFQIDSLAIDAIARQATPGCVIMAVQNGSIIYEKAFGYKDYSAQEVVNTQSVYDLASLTKICGTTLSIMKLVDEGKITLQDSIGQYLPFLKTDHKKQVIQIKELLLHEAGFVPYIPFYKETLEANGLVKSGIYSQVPSNKYSVPVSKDLYMDVNYIDTILLRIDQSPLKEKGNYVYSDMDFILLGRIVESVSGMSLDEYVTKNIYWPLGLRNTQFTPLASIAEDRIVPTEADDYFRRSLLRGYVHDQGAAMFGGVSGHAGLFSTAKDLAILMQTLLNGGSFGSVNLFRDSTVKKFVAYQSKSRRGFGFDKPERKTDGYPSKYASPATFGHTGYTGTCVWVDPEQKLVYVFLSNRVNPSVSSKLISLKVREKIMDKFYEIINPAMFTPQ